MEAVDVFRELDVELLRKLSFTHPESGPGENNSPVGIMASVSDDEIVVEALTKKRLGRIRRDENVSTSVVVV